jgi:hypothetical protein
MDTRIRGYDEFKGLAKVLIGYGELWPSALFHASHNAY